MSNAQRNILTILLLISCLLPVCGSRCSFYDFYFYHGDHLGSVKTRYEVGRYILEDEQHGNARAKYGDNPPIGIILGSEKDKLLMEYALHGISNQLFVSRYQLYLPDREQLERELQNILLEDNNQ